MVYILLNSSSNTLNVTGKIQYFLQIFIIAVITCNLGGIYNTNRDHFMKENLLWGFLKKSDLSLQTNMCILIINKNTT